MGNWKKILDIKDFFINNHGNVYHKINLLNIRQTVHGVAQIEMYALQFAHACDWKNIQAYHVIKNTYSNHES